MIDVRAIADSLLRQAGLRFHKLSLLELNRSSRTEVALALVVFLDDAPLPAAFLKATPDAARAKSLEHEFDNLRRLRELTPDSIHSGLPRPLALARVDALTVMGQSAWPGTRMKNFPPDRYFCSERFRRHFTRVLDWLAAFHRSTLKTAGDDDGDGTSEVRRFRDRYDRSTTLDELLDEAVEQLSTQSLPRVPLHADFCTANLLVSPEGEIGVVDWEYPLTWSWPLADLLTFLASIWCVPYAKGPQALAANYTRIFFGDHPLSTLARNGTRRYLAELDIPATVALPLSVMAWVTLANRKADERGPGAVAAPRRPLIMVEDRRCLNLELLAEHRRRYGRVEP